MKRALSVEESLPTYFDISPSQGYITSLSQVDVSQLTGDHSPPSKVRRKGSKVWTVIQRLKSSFFGQADYQEETDIAAVPPSLDPSPTPPRTPKGKFPFCSGIGQISSSLFHIPSAPTVVHRSTAKGRPSIPSWEIAMGNAPFNMDLSSNSNTLSSPDNSGNSSKPTETAETSLDSKFSSSKDNHSFSQKSSQTKRRNQANNGSSPDGILGTIQELGPECQVAPTIATVENAAAAKIYLETFYNEAMSKPSPRSLRRHLLESDLYQIGDNLNQGEKASILQAFYRQESEHLRQTRAMKVRSIRARYPWRHTRKSACEDYDVVKILGKGSFGVVRLVREKAAPGENPHQKQVYAMKVIRKSDMLRSCQEGHLRAERDFLVASEGSKWYI